MELEEPTGEFKPVVDHRPRVPEPLPVRLVSVDDVRLLAPAGLEVQLDGFYVALLGFERLVDSLSYRAENFTLHFDIIETRPVAHESMRPQGIEVDSLRSIEHKLIDREWEYVRQKGITPGSESLLLLDPAGNWLELTASPAVR